MQLRLRSASAADTAAIGAALADLLEPGDVVVVSGDLGAGKTCLVQGAGPALGVRVRITSPSFVLMRSYPGRIRVVHVDVYRLNSLQELIELGYEEVFDPDAVTFIEWGDAVAGVLPEERFEVGITGGGDDPRAIVVRARGEPPAKRLDAARDRFAGWEAP